MSLKLIGINKTRLKTFGFETNFNSDFSKNQNYFEVSLNSATYTYTCQIIQY